MQTWFSFRDQRWQLPVEDDDYYLSRQAAKSCASFIADDEDEQVDDVELSCVNCANRRWLINAIECTVL
ncbi:hypothetical protein K0I73_18200 [Shewanella mesophila]|uniref:hypothetical protein n=1 Tax=Shewanella mesophila TaxID=2864208 RepID=UPI001C65D117|nr:hypothetical protein [Shewanella mesophila]QYJ86057.1 hypothetical protein K0I73_18200 [Shewanella mesophila]